MVSKIVIVQMLDTPEISTENGSNAWDERDSKNTYSFFPFLSLQPSIGHLKGVIYIAQRLKWKISRCNFSMKTSETRDRRGDPIGILMSLGIGIQSSQIDTH